MHTVIPLQSHCISIQMGGITVGYKTLILSTQFKQDKVHRSDSPHCNPIWRYSETLPVFSWQCFHQNGWNHSGGRNFNPFHSVLLPTGMGGKLKTPSSSTVSIRDVTQYLSHDMTKPTKWVCAQRRLRSAWAPAQSDQSLCCPHEETLDP